MADLETGKHEQDKVTVDTYDGLLGGLGDASGKTQVTAEAAREALKDKGRWNKTTTVKDVNGQEHRVEVGALYGVIRRAEDAHDKDVKAEQARYADIPPPPPPEEAEQKGPTVTPVEGPQVTPVEGPVITIDEVTIVGDARKKEGPAHHKPHAPKEEKHESKAPEGSKHAEGKPAKDKPAATGGDLPAPAEGMQDVHVLNGNMPPLLEAILSIFPENIATAFQKIFAQLTGGAEGPEQKGPAATREAKAEVKTEAKPETKKHKAEAPAAKG